MSTTGESDRLALHAALGEAALRLRNESATYAEAVAATLGISRSELACLNVLYLEGPSLAGRLAESTGLTTGGVSGALDRLERAGLVQRETDPGDRRRVIVRFSPDQRTRLDDLFERLEPVDGGRRERYSDGELALLLRHTRESLAALQEETRRLQKPSSDESATQEERIFSAPLEGHSAATLEIVGGRHELVIRGSAALPGLFEARFAGPGGRALTSGDTVTLRSRAGRAAGPTGGEVSLNSSVPWAVRVRGGGGPVTADLRDVGLTEIDIYGGAGDAEFTLGAPSGSVPIRVTGGSRHLVFHRPRGTAARFTLRGVVTKLSIDGQDPRIAWGMWGTKWETPNFSKATDHFDIAVRGGAVSLELDET